MDDNNRYLHDIICKYDPRDVHNYAHAIKKLKLRLENWASSCYMGILDSGSRAKGTAISIASDVDLVVSLASKCNENKGGLKSIYDGLYEMLKTEYQNVRKQNVSVRITLTRNPILPYGLEIDITPARKQPGNTNDHNLWVSKLSTWKQTNIQRHITDVSQSNLTNEIKLIKIWRELNELEFPSIYLEYLIINHILSDIRCETLFNNFLYILSELGKYNPLQYRVVDPANSNNVLSDLLTEDEKNKICSAAKRSLSKKYMHEIIWYDTR